MQLYRSTMKPGYRTTEFWLSLAAGIAPFLQAAIPPTWAAALATASGAAYAIARGLAKLAGDR